MRRHQPSDECTDHCLLLPNNRSGIAGVTDCRWTNEYSGGFDPDFMTEWSEFPRSFPFRSGRSFPCLAGEILLGLACQSEMASGT